jgi:cell division protease FtsH
VIDSEVQKFVTEQYDRARSLLKDHHAALATLAQELLKQETVTGNAVKDALAKEPAQPLPAVGAHAAA